MGDVGHNPYAETCVIGDQDTMKCAPLFSLTLASTLVVATGCKKESEVAKAADTPAAPVAVPAEPAADRTKSLLP